jgi:hypothetical protein
MVLTLLGAYCMLRKEFRYMPTDFRSMLERENEADESSGGIQSAQGNNRRASQRYPLDLSVQRRLLDTGDTVFCRSKDISSGGVCLVACEGLTPGTRVELTIDWPFANGYPVKLKVLGTVVRVDENMTGVSIAHHKFHADRGTSAEGQGGARRYAR